MDVPSQEVGKAWRTGKVMTIGMTRRYRINSELGQVRRNAK